MQIQKMQLSDLEEIKDTLTIDFDDFWNYNILKSEIENTNARYFIVKEDKNIIGFAGFLITPDDAQIMNIVVRKNQRKKGIGTLLLEKIIEEVALEKRNVIFLEVNENNKEAIKLYNKFNFSEIARRKKYYDGTNDAIIMKKEI